MTEYVTNAEYAVQKSNLTRATKSGDPVRILTHVEKTLEAWDGKAWPDDWHRWARALDDAWSAFTRSPAYDDDQDINDAKIARRFRAAMDRIR